MEEQDDYIDRDRQPPWWERRSDLIAILVLLSAIIGFTFLVFLLKTRAWPF